MSDDIFSLAQERSVYFVDKNFPDGQVFVAEEWGRTDDKMYPAVSIATMRKIMRQYGMGNYDIANHSKNGTLYIKRHGHGTVCVTPIVDALRGVIAPGDYMYNTAALEALGIVFEGIIPSKKKRRK